MTQRAYDLRQLRSLPNLGFSVLRTAFQLVLTALGVIWLDPISAPLAIAGTLFFFGLSFLTRPILEERDLRLRTHIGALSRFYLDALLGLIPVKTHSAERAMRRQHEAQLYEWVRANRDYFNLASLVQSFGTLLYSIFAVLIVVNYLAKGGQPNEILLLFYWTLSLPTLGQTLANQVQQYPMLRNRVLRLLEPLGAPDEEDIWLQEAPAIENDAITAAGGANSQPVSVEMSGVYIQAGGHTILRDVNLKIEPGEHIAIVGLSGAGKSSLVGLLLGWHRPSQGVIQVDGEILDGKRVVSLRQETAWVDPAVQLWNRSLYENLRYGIEIPDGAQMGAAIQSARLYGVLERLPDGLKTSLGESGGLVSGGEGQRVRLGRAFLHPGTRLAILDEPFRGLDRDARRKLLSESRQHWKNVTLLCVTHDVSETLVFPRVLVIEDGQIIEDGQPAALADQPASRYRALLQAEQDVRTGLWQGADWRRLTIADGHLAENALPAADAGDER
jgi:ATP-binding cassette subfamily B protein